MEAQHHHHCANSCTLSILIENFRHLELLCRQILDTTHCCLAISGITMGHEESEGGKIDLSIKNALEFDLFVKYSLEITTTTGVRRIF